MRWFKKTFHRKRSRQLHFYYQHLCPFCEISTYSFCSFDGGALEYQCHHCGDITMEIEKLLGGVLSTG